MKRMLLVAVTLGLLATLGVSMAARADEDVPRAFSATMKSDCPSCPAAAASETAAVSGSREDALGGAYERQQAVAVSLHPAGSAEPVLRSKFPPPPRSTVPSEHLRAVIDWILAGAPSD